LAQSTFPDYKYVLLENPDEKLLATEDPRLFFQKYENPHGIIIDEIQEVPHLLSYMQGIVDKEYKPGYLFITGSQKYFNAMKKYPNACRTNGIVNAMPLSVSELRTANLLPATIRRTDLKGYTHVSTLKKIDASQWFFSIYRHLC
jgi:predicted AAA+ superfamily ATPase